MAIIGSMTPYEKRNPKVMDAKRKKRVAAGSGTKVEEINRLLKMHLQMAAMMKQMGQGKGMFGKMMGGGKGAPDAAEMEKMQAELAGLNPDALPEDLKDLMKGGAVPSLPQGLPGLGWRQASGPRLSAGAWRRRIQRIARIGQEEMTYTDQKEKIMAVKIRLARAGTKKRPYYHIVVADAASPA